MNSRNMGYDFYLFDAARTRTRNLFHHKCAPIPLGHSDGCKLTIYLFIQNNSHVNLSSKNNKNNSQSINQLELLSNHLYCLEQSHAIVVQQLG